MIVFLVPVVMSLSLTTSAEADAKRITQLCQERAEFDRLYHSPTKSKLRVVESLGTNNLGNPFRNLYFPAGSAKYQIHVVFYQGRVEYYGMTNKKTVIPDSGALVYQSWHGKHTTTDWVIELVAGKYANASGTVARMIASEGLKPKGRLTPSQRRFMEDKQAYVGFANGRGINEDVTYTWFMRPDGPVTTTGNAEGSSNVTRSDYGSDIVTFEEANYMGIHHPQKWLEHCLSTMDIRHR